MTAFSAPGKVILFGEHAVVYGKKAIAAAIGMRLTGSYTTSRKVLEEEDDDVDDNQQLVILSFNDFNNKQFAFNGLFFLEEFLSGTNVVVTTMESKIDLIRSFISKTSESGEAAKDDMMFSMAVLAFLFLYQHVCLVLLPEKERAVACRSFLNVHIKSEIPLGCGLGSSGAYAVVISAILADHFKLNDIIINTDWDDIVSSLASVCEQITHGPSASGLDNFVSLHGGFVSFCKGGDCSSIIKSDNDSISKVLLINTGISRSTKKMVQKVSIYFKNNEDRCNEIFGKINDISESFQLMSSTDIKENVALNQKLLSEIGVSHERIDAIIDLASQYGLSGKLTGAGGGGMVMILIDPKDNNNLTQEFIDRLENDLQIKDSYLLDLGAAGLRLVD